MHLPPEPGTLRTGLPPHWHALPGLVPLVLLFLLAAAFPLTGGLALFGWHVLRILAICVAVSLLVEAAFGLFTVRNRTWSESHALLMGVLLACTLPPDAAWYIPAIGAGVAVLLGHALLGGVGNYLWHPVALGRVAVQILFPAELTPERWSVLAPGHLLSGDLKLARPLPDLATWSTAALPHGAEAWLVTRPVDHLRSTVPGTDGPAEALATLVRDVLPPWSDTLLGLAGGAVGEAPVVAVLIGALVLVWRGFLRWPMALAGIAAAVVMAAILPVHIQPDKGAPVSHWLPATAVWQGLPVGLAYVAHHVTAGEFLLVLLLLAPDPSSSPLTLRGHVLFGVMIGAATMVLRIGFGIPAAGYWALLAANTAVPMLDRLTRRRVFGT